MRYDVVLVFPPIRVWDRPRNFPTGLGIIAGRLRAVGWRVAVIDANGERLSDDEVLARIRRYDPFVVGIGGLVTTYGWVKRVAGRIKAERPGRPIVLGGSVGSSIVETALRELAVDVVAVGEADETVLELVEALAAGRRLEEVAGLALLRGGQVVRTGQRAAIEDLDAIGWPAWDLFPMEVYLANPIVGVGRDIDIISSRGCPFDCHYCYRLFGRKFRARSAENVVGEVEALRREYGVDFISFQDDCFVVDRGRVERICELLDEKGLSRELRWSCTGRVTAVDRGLLERMRASGCVSVSYGIESGSDEILAAMGKKATIAQARTAIEATRAVGLRCPVSFMIGYPGETAATVGATVEFCREMNIPLQALMFTCPYPGTKLYEQVKGTERFRGQFATEEAFVERLGDAVDLTVNLTEMGDEELVRLRDEALATAQANYRAPGAAEVEAQERALYGEVLYRKAQEQMADPGMVEHRRRHGFNENKIRNSNIEIRNNDPISEIQMIETEEKSSRGLRGLTRIRSGVAEVGAGDGTSSETAGNFFVLKRSGEVKSTGLVGPWEGGRPWVVAEAGVNHGGDLGMALELVGAAKGAGADCVKFQAFSAEELAAAGAPVAGYQAAGGARSQREMLERLELREEDFRRLGERCREVGIGFMVTGFSARWVERLAGMGVCAVKVGSGNLTDPAVLEAAGRTGLPVVLSTGMGDLGEVERALERLRGAGAGPVAVLHCVSLYPTPLGAANLGAIRTLGAATGLVAGFSDHTQELETGGLAVAAGAAILEKHLTLDRRLAGPDHRMSVEPGELGEYVRLARRAWGAMGSGEKRARAEEAAVRRVVRLSVVALRDIAAGAVLERGMLTRKRPGWGIAAERLEDVVGRRARVAIGADEVLTEAMVEL